MRILVEGRIGGGSKQQVICLFSPSNSPLRCSPGRFCILPLCSALIHFLLCLALCSALRSYTFCSAQMIPHSAVTPGTALLCQTLIFMVHKRIHNTKWSYCKCKPHCLMSFSLVNIPILALCVVEIAWVKKQVCSDCLQALGLLHCLAVNQTPVPNMCSVKLSTVHLTRVPNS